MFVAIKFADIPGFEGIAPNAAVTVTDVWSGTTTAVTTGEYTARGVASHGTAFLTIEM